MATAGSALAGESVFKDLAGSVRDSETLVSSIQEPAPGPAAKGFETRLYRNAEGCEATVEQRRNGDLIYVREAGGAQAFLWLGKDLKSGEITAFCDPAAVYRQGDGSVKLACGEHPNGGYYTRGEAVLNLTGGLSAVSVRGDVKRTFGWKTDTNIACSGLRPADNRGVSLKSGKSFMGVEACSVLDGIYPSDMTNEEAQGTLGGCFSGISARYGVPVTFAAAGTEMTILVGPAKDGQPGGNAKAAADLKKELAARGGQLFDFKVSVAVAK
ncbi:MAG: hypothetical protein A2X35_08335 [Elusimicrobia bacterium GWA2_61_42]|nr:MAG: hypothetical protein A2X35_08335 [Elusimicrobia bacterium GWA2_61_42]